MNKPDDATLNRWLNGELKGTELEQVEAWAEVNADDFDETFQCNIGWEALRGEIIKSVPKSEEPPYPEFFNHKREQSILAEQEQPKESMTEAQPSMWQRFRWAFMPAAFAGMAVCFYAGTKMNNPTVESSTVVSADGAQQEVYVPQSGVVAKVSETEGSTEIILDGLTPIPDSLDIAAGDSSTGNSPMMMTKAQRAAIQAIYY